MDTHLMGKIFSNENTLSSLPTIRTYIDQNTVDRVGNIFKKMEMNSPLEADLVELHLLKGVPQGILGKIFGYTQPNIHYRLERGVKRLKVLMQLPDYQSDYLELRLRGFFTCEKDIRVMVLIYHYSSQSKVAEIVGESQGKVRYRFLKCLESLSHSESLNDLYLAYKLLEENLTLLRRSKKRERVMSIL